MTAVYTPIVARVTRSSVLKTRNQDYIQAALALGASWNRVVWRHVLPNSLGPIVVQATDIESLVLHSVSDLLDKGVLAETEDGHKIDLKKNIESKKKKKSKEEGEEEEE